jgi:preprotein translocase subunit Sec63
MYDGQSREATSARLPSRLLDCQRSAYEVNKIFIFKPLHRTIMDISVWIQCIVLTIGLIIVAAQDYYEILGVKRDATEKEIKRAFRQLGKKKKKKFFFS